MQWESVVTTLREFLFSLIIFSQSFFSALGFLPAPCEEPTLYTIEAVDERFGISQEEVRRAVLKAEAIWETAAGQDLFQYDKNVGLPVQFVYDERQQKTKASQDLQAKLDSLNVEKSEAGVNSQVALYTRAKTEYEQQAEHYQEAATQYNSHVEAVNKRGGATEKERAALENEYDALQEQFQKLESARLKVNSLATRANQHIEENRLRVETYNSEVTTFEDRYGVSEEVFDQGLYTGKDITIYQYDDETRLVLVLAHEMGHALGIDHVDDPEAIMYYLMSDQDINNVKLNETDKEALSAICQKPSFPWQG